MKRIMISIVCCLLALTYTYQAQASRPMAKHVILIAFDGWGAYSMEKAKVPSIRALMAEGCYTMKKRTVLPSSSAVNWASMFNGSAPEIHGYTTWNSRTPEIPSAVTNEHGIFPTIYSLMQEQMPGAETGCLYEWEGIKYLVDTLAISHHAQALNYGKQPDELCAMAERYIKEEKPALLAVCFDQLDHVGHAIGHDTPEYYAQLETLDTYVKRIVDAVRQAGIYDDTIIMMSSDHGGIKKDHGGKTLQEMETPFIIAGKGIKRGGGEFDELMMQYDVASTIAYVFGLKQPQAWIGRPAVQAFE